MDSAPEKDPRVYFAAERTFLAWIRTGLGLMGVGFAVSRFGLFLRTMQANASHLPQRSMGVSGWSGIAIVMLGVIVNIAAVLSHFRVVHQLNSGTWAPGISRPAVALAVLLAAVGLGMALYLTLVQ